PRRPPVFASVSAQPSPPGIRSRLGRRRADWQIRRSGLDPVTRPGIVSLAEGIDVAGAEAGTLWRGLVVDDDPAICRGLSRALGLSGFLVEVAGGGVEALSVLAANPPDAVVLDVSMPDVDGIAVVRRLRA